MYFKTYWKHLNNFYFKRIQIDQQNSLQYIRNILNRNVKQGGVSRLYYDGRMYDEIEQTLKQEYKKQDEQYENLLQTITIKIFLEEISDSKYKCAKKIEQQFLEVKKNGKKMNKKKLGNIINRIQKLQDQKCFRPNQLQDQIQALEAQLLSVNNNNKNSYQHLLHQIHKQNQHYSSNQFTHYHSVQNITLQNIKLLITILQKKQIAQSISKIIQYHQPLTSNTTIHSNNSSNHSLSNHKSYFIVNFDTSLDFPSKYTLQQQELLKFNSIRQISLLQSYNSGQKSLYSTIANNFVKFQKYYQLYNHPHTNQNTQLLKNNNLKNKNKINNINKRKDQAGLQQIKKKFRLSRLQSEQWMINNFQMCHHCKKMFPNNILINCSNYQILSENKFTNKQFEDKIQYQDSYFQYLFKKQNNNQNQMQKFDSQKKQQFFQKCNFSNNLRKRKIPLYNHYNPPQNQSQKYIKTKKICSRKYCKSCYYQYQQYNLKSQKNKINQKSNICAFCQGICFCTRCQRDQMIRRLKYLYKYYGGDIKYDIQRHSLIQKVRGQVKQDMDRFLNEDNKDYNYKGIKNGNKKKNEKNKEQSEKRLKGKCYESLLKLKKNLDEQYRLCGSLKRQAVQSLNNVNVLGIKFNEQQVIRQFEQNKIKDFKKQNVNFQNRVGKQKSTLIQQVAINKKKIIISYNWEIQYKLRKLR